MELQDFRVGNIVQHEPIWSYRNEDFKSFPFKITFDDFFALGECRFSDEAISPIEINLNWLELMGFVKHETYLFTWELRPHKNIKLVAFSYTPYKPFSVDFLTKLDSADSEFRITNTPIKITYVHQVQNLYHALTGEELQFSKEF